MKVFIGDPCYILGDKNYDSLLWNTTDEEDEIISSEPNLITYPETWEDEDEDFDWDRLEEENDDWRNTYPHPDLGFSLSQSTWIGDGIYRDLEGNEYPVDSGQIGIIPEILWDKEKMKKIEGLGLITEIDPDSSFYLQTKNGTFWIGGRTILTGPGDENGDISYDEEEDDED